MSKGHRRRSLQLKLFSERDVSMEIESDVGEAENWANERGNVVQDVVERKLWGWRAAVVGT